MSLRRRMRGRANSVGGSSKVFRAGSPTPASRVNLHVAELTVASDIPVERYRLAEGFEAEMRRLFLEGGIPKPLYESCNRDRVAASGALQHLPAAGVARELAGAVYVGLGGIRAHPAHISGATPRGGT